MEFVGIGKLKKPHGLKGEIKLSVEDKFWDAMADGVDVFFIEQKGRKTPYFVEYLRGKGSFILKLEDVDSKEDAKFIANRPIFLRRKDILMTDEELLADDSGLEYFFLKNYTVHDTNLGLIGQILSIEDYPQQEMAVIQYKNKQILIPLMKNWIKSIDKNAKKITLELPEGLLEL